MKAKKLVLSVMLGIGTAAIAAPSITNVTAQQRYPWNGKFDISYTAKDVAKECQTRGLVATLKVFAVEQTTLVTNVAEAAYLFLGPRGDQPLPTDTSPLTNGTHHVVWDMDAQGVFSDLVSTNFEVFVSVETVPQSAGVQLWKDGPYWAECNVGTTNPEGYGYFFWWGDTEGCVYYSNGMWNYWITANTGAGFEFYYHPTSCTKYCPTTAMTFNTLKSNGYVDSSGNLVAAHDAATANWGAPWHTPTFGEIKTLCNTSVCTSVWITTNGVPGRLVTGLGDYANRSIFLPAAGCGDRNSHYESGELCHYWSSTYTKEYDLSSTYANYSSKSLFASERYLEDNYDARYSGLPVRPVRAASSEGSFSSAVTVLFVAGSGAVRADLRTGAVREAAATETLTYSTAWIGGDTATLAINDEQVLQETDSGIYKWVPMVGGSYELTHTVVTGGVSVVDTAWFWVVLGTQEKPWRIGVTADDEVVAWTNGIGTLHIEGAGEMKSFAADGSDVPWPRSKIAAVEVASDVTNIGTNVWRGLGASVTYNGLSASAVIAMANGFGIVTEYGRTTFNDIQVANGSVSASLAIETANSLTNGWNKVMLKADDITVDDNGNIIISHETGGATQGFYQIQSSR